jgi:hypothetical protein
MTFKETIEALPEADRLKFFRALLEVSEAGRKVGVPADEWGSLYAEVYNEVEKNT